MFYKVLGIELKSRPFHDDPWDWAGYADKTYGTIGLVIRPLTPAEAAAYAEHLRQLNWMETNDKHLN